MQTNLLTRDDTMLGICQGIGEDLGIDPNWLRVTVAVLLFWNPAVVVSGYFAAGLVVMFTRLLVPEPRLLSSPAAQPDGQASASREETEAKALPLAA